MHLRSEYHGYQVYIGWEITQRCNYACTYCASYNNDLPFQFKTLSEYEKAVSFIRSCLGNKTGKINILGGEPTLFKGWVDLLNVIDSYGFIPHVTTNLSVPIEKYVNKIIPKKVINPSYHPQFSDPDEFIMRVEKLREYDLLTSVSVMADTSNWDKVLKVYNALSEVAHISKLRDEFSSDNDVSAGYIHYTEEQENIIRESNKDFQEYSIFLDNKEVTLGDLKSDYSLNFKGWKCAMGQDRLAISPNGDIFPSACLYNFRMSKIGNIFREEFKKLDRAVICPFNHCSCGPDIRIEKWAHE